MENNDKITPHYHLIEYKRCGNLFYQSKNPKNMKFSQFWKFWGKN